MTRQDLMEKRLYFMILAMQMSTSLMKLLVFLFTLAIYQNYKEMIILYNHFPSLSLSTVLYIFVTSYFSLRAMQSRQRGCKKLKLILSFRRSTQGHPLGSFLRSSCQGRHETQKRCVTTLMTDAKETTPVAFGLFQIACDFDELKTKQRVCGQANGSYTSH